MIFRWLRMEVASQASEVFGPATLGDQDRRRGSLMRVWLPSYRLWKPSVVEPERCSGEQKSNHHPTSLHQNNRNNLESMISCACSSVGFQLNKLVVCDRLEESSLRLVQNLLGPRCHCHQHHHPTC